MPKRPSPVPTLPRNTAEFWFKHIGVSRMPFVVRVPPRLCFTCGRVFRNEFNLDQHFWCIPNTVYAT